MKINVIRNLILPWLLFFVIAIVAIVVTGIHFPAVLRDQQLAAGAIGLGLLLCLFANIRTLKKAGIWIAHSLPSSLRYNSRPWILRALYAAGVALVFFMVGQLPWVPLIWQAFVIPAVFSITLFVGIWSLMGPILTWASRISFSRTVAFLVSLPIFALVPVTALFLGNTILTAYLASHPEVMVAQIPLIETEWAGTEAAAVLETPKVSVSSSPSDEDPQVKIFRSLAESGQTCFEQTKEIAAALDPQGKEDVVYWAVRSIKCSELGLVVGLPKLADLMIKHPSAKVRAAAIRAMPRYGSENIKRIGYLIVKRINEQEDIGVIEAASIVLSRAGEEERKFVTNRLKSLLDDKAIASAAARILIQELKREDLVSEFVSENLAGPAEGRMRAVRLICALPVSSRGVAEPHIESVVASITSGAKEDPAMMALDCLGKAGFQAIREEVVQPDQLDRSVAARALAEMNLKNATQEALETAQNCVRDTNESVRKYCSQSLGKIGAPALPKILDLLKSNDSELKEAGRNALNYFDDPNARQELEKVRDENSGWLANRKNLRLAEAVNTALIKIEAEEAQESGVPAKTEVQH
jgi:HEAT repeat protein